MFQITVNENNRYEVALHPEMVTVNGTDVKPNLIKLSDTRYHLLLNEKSFRITILEQENPKELVLEVNGNRYNVSVKDQYDQLLHELGMDKALSAQAEDVKAPMPGLVIDVLIQEGEQVEKDMPLLILEAMKMENVLKAAAAGTVSRINVKAKDAVEKGQVLISFQ
jgi:biotin carboxyl carrier protein